MVDPSTENGVSKPTSETVYVTFTGQDRTTSTGIPVHVKGWWEIRGLTMQAAMEVAYAMAGDNQHLSCRVAKDMPWNKFWQGCTYLFVAGAPSDARAMASAGGLN